MNIVSKYSRYINFTCKLLHLRIEVYKSHKCNVTLICSTTYNFQEHGSYGWNVSETNLCSNIYTIREPVNTYLREYLLHENIIIILICGTVLVNNCNYLPLQQYS